MKIIASLGGFETVMCFVGSVDKMVWGSGLEEKLAEIYAENKIEHILSSKLVSKSLLGHFLVESALKGLLFDLVLDNFEIGNHSLKLLVVHMEDTEIESAVEEIMSQSATKSRTLKLWLQYLHYTNVLKKFFLAERTSNWHLHLASTVHMLNLFASTSHNKYATLAQLYVQQMKSQSSIKIILYLWIPFFGYQFFLHGWLP